MNGTGVNLGYSHTVPIAMNFAHKSVFNEFFLSHKGDLTLAFSALAYVASWFVLTTTRWKTPAEISVSMAEAALIAPTISLICPSFARKTANLIGTKTPISRPHTRDAAAVAERSIPEI